MKRLTKEFLLEKGFKLRPSIIQESYYYILENIDEEDVWNPTKGSRWFHYKEISVCICNDKGEGEWYLFLRDGTTADRSEDDIVTLTSALMYEEEVIDFLRLLGV